MSVAHKNGYLKGKRGRNENGLDIAVERTEWGSVCC